MTPELWQRVCKIREQFNGFFSLSFFMPKDLIPMLAILTAHRYDTDKSIRAHVEHFERSFHCEERNEHLGS